MSIKRIVERTSWPRFLIWFAVWFAYSFWAFSADTPWTRALKAAGGILPEMQPGFPPIEPQRTLESLGPATGDYVLWQVYDIPYMILNVIVIAGAMALALKALRKETSALRFFIAAPFVYLAAEIVENALLALFALRYIEPSEPLVLVQQLATTVKMGAGWPSYWLALASLVIAALAPLIARFRKRA